MRRSPGDLRDLRRLHDESVGVRLLLVVRIAGPGPGAAAGAWGLRGCRGAGARVPGGGLVGAVLLLRGGRAVGALLPAACACGKRVGSRSKNGTEQHSAPPGSARGPYGPGRGCRTHHSAAGTPAPRSPPAGAPAAAKPWGRRATASPEAHAVAGRSAFPQAPGRAHQMGTSASAPGQRCPHPSNDGRPQPWAGSTGAEHRPRNAIPAPASSSLPSPSPALLSPLLPCSDYKHEDGTGVEHRPAGTLAPHPSSPAPPMPCPPLPTPQHATPSTQAPPQHATPSAPGSACESAWGGMGTGLGRGGVQVCDPADAKSWLSCAHHKPVHWENGPTPSGVSPAEWTWMSSRPGQQPVPPCCTRGPQPGAGQTRREPQTPAQPAGLGPITHSGTYWARSSGHCPDGPC